jgi:hypothetical protein
MKHLNLKLEISFIVILLCRMQILAQIDLALQFFLFILIYKFFKSCTSSSCSFYFPKFIIFNWQMLSQKIYFTEICLNFLKYIAVFLNFLNIKLNGKMFL